MEIKLDIIPKMENDFQGFIDSFDHPIIVTDGDMKVLTKNDAARFYIVGMDVGKTISNHFSNEEEQRIRDLNCKETVFCELKYQTTSFGANVFGLGDRRMIVINPLSSRLCESLRSVYNRMSGYDMNLREDNLMGEELVRRLNTKYASAFVTERLRDIFTTRKLPYFDLHTTLSDFVAELKSLGFPAYLDYSSMRDEKVIVSGSEGEFLLLLAVVVFLSDFGDDDIVFETEFEENRVFCRIITDVISDSDDTELETRFSASNRFDGEFGEKRFWSHLANLIANANLWDISIEKSGDKSIFTISSEFTTHYAGTVFRDTKNTMIKQLMTLFFTNPVTPD